MHQAFTAFWAGNVLQNATLSGDFQLLRFLIAQTFRFDQFGQQGQQWLPLAKGLITLLEQVEHHRIVRVIALQLS
ncbi:Uncharacterised protein [Vibrio cholerae]|nr:Uncharacterised protein [Vibrio cholerae]